MCCLLSSFLFSCLSFSFSLFFSLNLFLFYCTLSFFSWSFVLFISSIFSSLTSHLVQYSLLSSSLCAFPSLSSCSIEQVGIAVAVYTCIREVQWVLLLRFIAVFLSASMQMRFSNRRCVAQATSFLSALQLGVSFGLLNSLR
jgi:hypothetical protein